MQEGCCTHCAAAFFFCYAFKKSLFQALLLGVLFQQFPLQEGGLDALAVPVGLVALADDSDQVPLLGMVHGIVQGIQTVGDLHELCLRVALVHAHADIRKDVLHLLKAVVILGEDGEIGHLGADLAHAVAAQLGAPQPNTTTRRWGL